jgi:hypothetical protein
MYQAVKGREHELLLSRPQFALEQRSHEARAREGETGDEYKTYQKARVRRRGDVPSAASMVPATVSCPWFYMAEERFSTASVACERGQGWSRDRKKGEEKRARLYLHQNCLTAAECSASWLHQLPDLGYASKAVRIAEKWGR